MYKKITDRDFLNIILDLAERCLSQKINVLTFCYESEPLLNEILNTDIKKELKDVWLDLEDLSHWYIDIDPIEIPHEEKVLIEKKLEIFFNLCQKFLTDLKNSEDPYAWPFDDYR